MTLISDCRSCGHSNLVTVVDLGDQAWCNHFLHQDEIGHEKTYPLRMVRCEDCALCQLDYTVPKEVMFTDHPYLSGTTTTLSDHFHEVAKDVVAKFPKPPVVLDIGGNDGTQLLQYQKAGVPKFNLHNVESAKDPANISGHHGINTYHEFFNEEFVHKYGMEDAFHVINASGVFFHLEELHSVCRGVKAALKMGGTFVVQFMYLGSMIEKLSFDGIYHEHLCYYSVSSLRDLLAKYGIGIYHAYKSDIHGGSIIAYCAKGVQKSYSMSVERFIKEEEETVSVENLNRFSHNIRLQTKEFKNRLLDFQQQGKKIYGIGAPAKANTLLTYADIDNTIMDCIFEVNPEKCGLSTPVTHIPIFHEDNIGTVESDSVFVILSWNFYDEIVSSLSNFIAVKNITVVRPFE